MRVPNHLERGGMRINMTPMIDVTFQLVIFFMIAAPYSIQKTLDLPYTKPDPDAAGAVTMEELEEQNVIVRIATDGSIFVDDEPVAVEELVDSLRGATRSHRSAELVLDVEDEALHELADQHVIRRHLHVLSAQRVHHLLVATAQLRGEHDIVPHHGHNGFQLLIGRLHAADNQGRRHGKTLEKFAAHSLRSCRLRAYGLRLVK